MSQGKTYKKAEPILKICAIAVCNRCKVNMFISVGELWGLAVAFGTLPLSSGGGWGSEVVQWHRAATQGGRHFCSCIIFSEFNFLYVVALLIRLDIIITIGWSAWLSGRTPVSGQRSFAVLRSTCS